MSNSRKIASPASQTFGLVSENMSSLTPMARSPFNPLYINPRREPADPAMTAFAILILSVSMAATARPTLEEVRKDMGAPSTNEVRGQRDTVGYATTPEAMAKVWELSAQGPAPESFGAKVSPGVLGVIGPHDDYIYSARVYRRGFSPLPPQKVGVVGGVFGFLQVSARG